MSTGQHATSSAQSLSAYEQILNVEESLGPNSFTVHRLKHASPRHLHITSRRCFIGPIPQGWLKSKKHRLLFSSYSSRSATFSAGDNVSHQRQITGLDGPSVSAIYRPSFRQPVNLDEEEAVDEDPPEDDLLGKASSAQSHASERDDGDTHGIKSQQTKQNSPGKASGPSLAGAESRAPVDLKRRSKYSSWKSNDVTSFVTARETKSEETPPVGDPGPEIAAAVEPESTRFSSGSSLAPQSPSIGHLGGPTDDNNSTASLLVHRESDSQRAKKTVPADTNASEHLSLSPKKSNVDALRIDGSADLVTELPEPANLSEPAELRGSFEHPMKSVSAGLKEVEPISSGLVRFNIPDQPTKNSLAMSSRQARGSSRMSLRQIKKYSSKPGELLKAEKMLVRVDSTIGDLPPDYDENSSLKSETRPLEKWRELVVACRRSTEDTSEFVIQMYKSRVIPEVEETEKQTRAAHHIPLVRKTTSLNLYSSLDKTIVLWTMRKKTTRIYILRPRSSAIAVEWYTFLRSTLGWQRPASLTIHVPDLNVTLQLDNPFDDLELSGDRAKSSETNLTALIKTMQAEKAVASTVIYRCMDLLQNSPELGDVVDSWLLHEKMGLAWKRYDRLEWIYGANEQKMYGTMAMEKSHDLELRPKQHYPTTSHPGHDAKSHIEEPPPVEGFLIRLTSQKGREKRFGKMYFKKLYFSAHNQFLCFSRPAKAMPPKPPKIVKKLRNDVPTAAEITDTVPIIFSVDPYPINDGRVSWLSQGTVDHKVEHDEYAFSESERKINTLLEAEGYINLCQVIRIRHVHRNTSPPGENLGNASIAEPDCLVDTNDNDPDPQHTEDDRTFELVLQNKLVVRLQAYDRITKREWMTRLGRIVEYWKLRVAGDMNLYKLVRRTNLKKLDVDEEMESFLGQYARKWEVSRAVASPQLYNMCGISCCRTVTMSGVLYRKPRMHSTFKRGAVILCHGHLLIFQGAIRKHSGKEIPHIHHEREQVIDLKNTYVYSGLITEGDLLYQNQTFDNNHPGHHPLPRVYLEDNWTSSDEDTMTCFVIWHGMKKSFFRANSEGGSIKQRLRYVSRLGVPGRSIVFKTRSRAERDHWVMNIGMEIERLQQAEEIRVIPKK